jgi:Sulfotransferase family
MTDPLVSDPSNPRGPEDTPSQRRLPDFFIVGHPKCGTTALHEMLGCHPDIFMPDNKEPNWMASDMVPRFERPWWGVQPRTLTEYAALFDGASESQLVGEASTLYLTSKDAAANIAHLNPDAYIIAIFREPAAFIRSFHLECWRMHEENELDLRRALALETRRRQGCAMPRRARRPQLLLYSEHVKYAEQLERYQAMFPDGRVMVLIYEELRASNAGALTQILRFLGRDTTVNIAPVHTNASTIFRSRMGHDLLMRLAFGVGPYSGAAKRAPKLLWPRSRRQGLVAQMERFLRGKEPPPPDEQIMAELRARYKPEVEQFGALIGRDMVKLWGYA